MSANGSFCAFESGSGSFISLGRRGTPSTSTSLQRDFDGEGYNEDVDSIADLIDSMRRDFLLTTTTTMTTMTTTTTTTKKTTDPEMRESTSTKEFEREFSRELSQASTRSGGAQSGKWDSSVDQIIPDIFARIYGFKGVPQ